VKPATQATNANGTLNHSFDMLVEQASTRMFAAAARAATTDATMGVASG
jgi:hypothetical protein